MTPTSKQSLPAGTGRGGFTKQLAVSLAGLFVLVSSMGASCSPRIGSPFGLAGPPAPVVLESTATAADVVAAVNANAARVQTYQAPSATISMPESAGLPLVQASLAAERPLRFRLRATTAITGPEIDLGSNDERFWIWARRNEPPAIYTARHDQWAASPVRGQVPIEPAWLMDAMGLAQLDPNAPYLGPVPHGDGALELRTQVVGPGGAQQRTYVVDAQTAWVREQHVYDAAGSLTASVFCDRFRYDPATQVSLPERVRLSVPGAGLELTINTGPVVVNAPLADGGQLWSLPQVPGSPTIDLTSPGGAPATPTNAWDLTGVSNVYGRTEPIATPFVTPSPGPRVAENPTPEAPANEAAAPAAPITPKQPTPGYALPVATPLPAAAGDVPVGARSGFTGLPTGGRAF